jgi:NADPH:quinone reductase-like Zn-dependent oxidoreductase
MERSTLPFAGNMRQVWITRHGPPEVLELREAAVPEPSGDEVLIKVAAAGINFADIMARLGLYPDAPKPPCVVGYEVAGEVAAAGPSAGLFAVGDRVVALTRFGGYSSYVSAPQQQVFALPADLNFAQGAALPVTYLTAYQLVIVMGRLHADETILVHSAAGGVGLSAIDLATIIGARVIGVASSAKHDFLRRRGVQGLIDSRAGDMVDRAKQLTGGRGVDLVLDARGGRSWRDSYDCLAPTGRLAVFGLATAVGGGRWLGTARSLLGVPWLRFNPLRLMNDNRGVFGVNIGHLWGQHEMIRNWMIQILEGNGKEKSRRWSIARSRLQKLRRLIVISRAAATSERSCWCREEANRRWPTGQHRATPLGNALRRRNTAVA